MSEHTERMDSLVRKGLGFVMLLIAGVVGYMMFRPKTTATPNVQAPQVDVNDAAGRLKDAGNAGADQVSTWTPETWRILSTLLVAGLVVYLFVKYKALRWIAIGCAIGWVVVMVAV